MQGSEEWGPWLPSLSIKSALFRQHGKTGQFQTMGVNYANELEAKLASAEKYGRSADSVLEAMSADLERARTIMAELEARARRAEGTEVELVRLRSLMLSMADSLYEAAKSAHSAWNLYAATPEGKTDSRHFGLERGAHNGASFKECRHGKCEKAREIRERAAAFPAFRSEGQQLQAKVRRAEGLEKALLDIIAMSEGCERTENLEPYDWTGAIEDAFAEGALNAADRARVALAAYRSEKGEGE